MKTIKLAKQVNLHVINTDKFKTTTICLLIRRPLVREETTIQALIPNILKHGSTKYDSVSKINRKMEEMYGSSFSCDIIKKGEEQIIQVYLDIINMKEDKLIDEALEFLKEIVFNPLEENDAFNEKYTNTEIENLRKGIEGRTNNKAEYAKLRCLEEMCSEEPFGIYGDGYISDLDKLDNKKIYWHYKRILNNSPIEFIVIGSVNEHLISSKIKEIFPLDRTNIIKFNEISRDKKKSEIKKVKEQMDVTQGKICIGLRSGIKANSNDFYKLMVTNEMLGGGPNSKLFSSVREEQSLCYYINSFVYRMKGILFIQSGADTKNLERILKQVEMEIENLQKGNFKKEEFENAKRNIIKKFESTKDFPSNMMDFYISQYMVSDKNNLDEFLKKFNEVNIDDIKKTAEKLYIDTVYTLEGESV